jgi:voltage-gated potassium channel
VNKHVDTAVQKRALRRFIAALSALIMLLIVGTAGYRILGGEEWSLTEAFYMAVITVSTVGFGEVEELSGSERLFTVLLIIGGGGLAAYSLGSVAEFLLSGEWRAHLEYRRWQRMLARLSQHIIVCGYGRVGRHVAQGLDYEGLSFIVIDPDPKKIAALQEMGYLGLQGNAADEDDLKEAGIERAQGLIAAANSDAENVFIVLTARGLRPDMNIVARANYEASETKLLRAGANRVILPYSIAGRRMVTMMMRPDVADFLDEVAHTSDLELLLDQIYIAPNSPLVGQTLAQMQMRHHLDVTVLACRIPGGPMNTRPGADTVLKEHAQLVVIGTRDQILTLTRLAEEAKPLPEAEAR